MAETPPERPLLTLPATPAPVPVTVNSVEVAPTLERWSAAKVAWRALLAVLVLVLFYVFALAVAAGLLLIAWLQVQLVQRGGGSIPWLVIVPPLVALSILLALRPRGGGWEDPGRGLQAKDFPDLFDVLRDVARRTGQAVPRRVYLFDANNAFVARRGIFMGTAIGLGIPLIERLTVDELRAVVAHEFGHLASRGGGLTTFVYRSTRTFMRATAAAGGVPLLDGVFELWATVYLHVAMPIARQHELRADEMACRIAGTEVTVSALAKIHADDEIANPVAGWEQDLHETHPPLRERIGLARAARVAEPPTRDDRPATVLLGPLRERLEEARIQAEGGAG